MDVSAFYDAVEAESSPETDRSGRVRADSGNDNDQSYDKENGPQARGYQRSGRKQKGGVQHENSRRRERSDSLSKSQKDYAYGVTGSGASVLDVSHFAPLPLAEGAVLRITMPRKSPVGAPKSVPITKQTPPARRGEPHSAFNRFSPNQTVNQSLLINVSAIQSASPAGLPRQKPRAKDNHNPVHAIMGPFGPGSSRGHQRSQQPTSPSISSAMTIMSPPAQRAMSPPAQRQAATSAMTAMSPPAQRQTAMSPPAQRQTAMSPPAQRQAGPAPNLQSSHKLHNSKPHNSGKKQRGRHTRKASTMPADFQKIYADPPAPQPPIEEPLPKPAVARAKLYGHQVFPATVIAEVKQVNSQHNLLGSQGGRKRSPSGTSDTTVSAGPSPQQHNSNDGYPPSPQQHDGYAQPQSPQQQNHEYGPASPAHQRNGYTPTLRPTSPSEAIRLASAHQTLPVARHDTGGVLLLDDDEQDESYPAPAYPAPLFSPPAQPPPTPNLEGEWEGPMDSSEGVKRLSATKTMPRSMGSSRKKPTSRFTPNNNYLATETEEEALPASGNKKEEEKEKEDKNKNKEAVDKSDAEYEDDEGLYPSINPNTSMQQWHRKQSIAPAGALNQSVPDSPQTPVKNSPPKRVRKHLRSLSQMLLGSFSKKANAATPSASKAPRNANASTYKNKGQKSFTEEAPRAFGPSEEFLRLIGMDCFHHGFLMERTCTEIEQANIFSNQDAPLKTQHVKWIRHYAQIQKSKPALGLHAAKSYNSKNPEGEFADSPPISINLKGGTVTTVPDSTYNAQGCFAFLSRDDEKRRVFRILEGDTVGTWSEYITLHGAKGNEIFEEGWLVMRSVILEQQALPKPQSFNTDNDPDSVASYVIVRRTSWKRFYVVLDRCGLRCFASKPNLPETESKHDAKPTLELKDLPNISAKHVPVERFTKPHCIEIEIAGKTGDNALVFMCSSTAEAENWLVGIKRYLQDLNRPSF
eukprot:g10022.t1